MAEPTPPAAPRGGDRRVARNTAIFSVATGFSRVAGLVREIVAAAYFGTQGAASAFTVAFQVPNLVRALVADAALSSAFVPVFSELLVERRRREAIHLATALAGFLLVALTLVTLAFMLAAPVVMPLFTGGEFTPLLDDLTVGLSQVLFPIVVLKFRARRRDSRRGQLSCVTRRRSCRRSLAAPAFRSTESRSSTSAPSL